MTVTTLMVAAPLAGVAAPAHADCEDPGQPPCEDPVPSANQVIAIMAELTDPVSAEEAATLDHQRPRWRSEPIN
jgi:hypothetical protein